MRRSAFDQLHGLRQWHVRGQRQQHVSMILRAAGNERLESVLVSNATEECPKIVLDFGRDEIASIFRREDAMDEVGNVGMRHSESVERMERCGDGIIFPVVECRPKLGCGLGVPTARESISSTRPGVEKPGYYQASLQDATRSRPHSAHKFPQYFSSPMVIQPLLRISFLPILVPGQQ
jgi:hypothetical protein